jgi:hypothetical protein
LQREGKGAGWLNGGPSSPLQFRIEALSMLLTDTWFQQREPDGGRAIVLILAAVTICCARVAIQVDRKGALSAGLEQGTR